jgi:hypothetical protein
MTAFDRPGNGIQVYFMYLLSRELTVIPLTIIFGVAKSWEGLAVSKRGL